LFTASGTIFFVHYVEVPAAQVGVVLSVGAVAGLVCAGPVGMMADRIGVRRVLLAALIGRAVAYGALALANGVRAYAVLVVAGVIGDQVTPALQQALVGEFVPGPARTSAMATLRAVRNVGLTVGLLLAGVVLQTGSTLVFRVAMLANGVSFLVLAATVASIATAPALRRVDSDSAASSSPSRAALRDTTFLVITAGNGLVLLHDAVLFVLLPLWLIGRTHLPTGTVALLLAINTAGTVVLQAALGRTALARSWAAGFRIAGLTLILMCAAFAVAEQATGRVALACTVLAVVLLTVGENVHAIAAWDLSYRLAPPHRSAEYLAVFGLSTGLAAVIGPVLMTAAILRWAPTGWLVLALVISGGVATVLLGGNRMLGEQSSPAQVVG